jgi:hypothetical protein
MKKLQLILAGFLLTGATVVMAQDPATQEPKQSDQYSNEQTTPVDSTVQETPDNNAVTPNSDENQPDGSSSTTTPSDTTAITPPAKEEMGSEESSETPTTE